MSGAGAAHRHALDRLRHICLGYPESEERETWGQPTFRVRGKIFAMFGITDDESPTAVTTLKSTLDEQRSLLATGHPFFYPSYVGSKGWIGVVLDDATDWTEIAELVDDSYRAVAPSPLIARLRDLDHLPPAL